MCCTDQSATNHLEAEDLTYLLTQSIDVVFLYTRLVNPDLLAVHGHILLALFLLRDRLPNGGSLPFRLVDIVLNPSLPCTSVHRVFAHWFESISWIWLHGT